MKMVDRRATFKENIRQVVLRCMNALHCIIQCIHDYKRSYPHSTSNYLKQFFESKCCL